ncbi:nucleotidyltransferase family protein [Yoonia maritima]|uniref:nucleotidyltransferase family protein n=1 Tax=Yoonia maritima TaxID=1435347 RepID=UPI000D10F6D8|nr:GSU2403 family nucleotidyltransferase fold protein [Yoonia maritima]
MIKRHSSIAHAAYHDLLRSLRDEAMMDIRGTPTKITRGDKAYWYDTFRVGTDVRKTYIGEDSPALSSRLSKLTELRAAAKDRQANRTRLIRILRAEGFMSTDAATGSLLSAMAKAGVFRLGGTVVGTHAFRLYEGELGLRYGFDDTAQTGDIDIASFERLSLALEDAVSPPLHDVFRDFSFDPVPSLRPENVWRWKQTRNDLMVEFLTPSFEADEGIRPLAALGVDAQSLHHLNYLIQDPIPAAILYRSGTLVQIPQPERFAIHKLIVADRRRDGPDQIKAIKDRAQAAFLINALTEDRPDELRDAYEVARNMGPRWEQRLDGTLARMPDTARILAEL